MRKPQRVTIEEAANKALQETLDEGGGGLVVDLKRDMIGIVAPDMEHPLVLDVDEACGLVQVMLEGIKQLDDHNGRVRCRDCFGLHADKQPNKESIIIH